MNTTIAALLLFVALAQRLPSELPARPLEIQQLPATQLERPPVSGVNAPFNLEYVGADLRLVLTSLAQAHGLNLVMPPDVSGTVSINLRAVTLTQALDAILPARGLAYSIEGKLLRVDRIQMDTRTFQFNYIATQRTLSPLLHAGVESADVMTELEAAINALKSPEGKVVFQRTAGIVVVTDYARYLDTIDLFLETVESSVHRQVVLDAKVVEVTLNDASRGGVDWMTLRTAANSDMDTLISTLNTYGDVNVVSNPIITTLNNQPAILRVENQIILDITPQISDDGFITMNVHPTITERTVREANIVVRVRQRETAVISGLLSQRDSGDGKKTDLAILITPRLLDIQAAVDYTKQRMLAQDQLKTEKQP